jgi:CheY-like chemotaxis protein
MKILIAEDNEDQQILISCLMNDWLYDCDLVSNGRRAVELAQKNDGQYDLCLMDIDMPVMDGLEAAKIIRQKTRYFPIVAVTGDLKPMIKYREAGIDDILQKPYYPTNLYAKISELTVKAVTIRKEQNQIILRKETPVDSEELKELRELDKKGLAKFSLIDTGHKFIVHKNLQNKISHDFIAKKKQLSEFLDRSTDDPGIIHVYASNLRSSKRHLLPEVLEQMVKEEDEDMKKYTAKAEYPEKEDTENLMST